MWNRRGDRHNAVMHGVIPPLAAVLLTVAAMAQVSPQTAPASRSARVSGSKLRFLDHFTPDYRTVFVLDDPLPHLDRLLKSERLRRVVSEGKFGSWLKTLPGLPRSIDLQELSAVADADARPATGRRGGTPAGARTPRFAVQAGSGHDRLLGL
jgi:hypothetical protein